jgi:hypothetical protein
VTTQPEALRLADALEALNGAKKLLPCVGGETLGTEVYRIRLSGSDAGELLDAAAELRRLHAINAELLEALTDLLGWQTLAPDDVVAAARAAIDKAEEVKP